MTPQEKIARLESLLERVRRNVVQPRERLSSALTVEDDELSEEPIDGVSAAPAMVETSVVEVSEPIAAIETDFGELEIEELDLTDEEIVDLTEAEELPEEVPVAAAAPESLDWEEAVEPPASSRRPIAAASMDEALAGATSEVAMEEGREIPLKTPPPESGPQEAPLPQMGAAPVPLIEEADIQSAPVAPQGEALLELEEPPAAALEVEQTLFEPAVEAPAAPPEPVPESGQVAPQVVQRPAPVQSAPSAYVAAARGFSPQSFAELLDASLALRAE